MYSEVDGVLVSAAQFLDLFCHQKNTWLKSHHLTFFFPKALYALCFFSIFKFQYKAWALWLKNTKLCVSPDHLALCSVPCSTLRAMEIPPCWCCLKRFWDRLIPRFTETLNTMFGFDPNGVSNTILQSCSFCKMRAGKPSWRTDVSGNLGF